MLRFNAVVLIIMLSSSRLIAGEPPFVPFGADNAAMTFASVAGEGHWSAFHNQALMPLRTTFSAGIAFESRFMTTAMSSKGLSVIIPGNKAPMGLIMSHFGNAQYSRLYAGLGSAVRLSDGLFAGAQADLVYIRGAGEYLDACQIAFEAGMAALITPELTLGFHIMNPFPSLNSLSSSVNTGLSWKASDELRLSAELSKVICEPLSVHTGICWAPGGRLAIRAGYMSSPSSISFGLGIITGNVIADIGFIMNEMTGLTSTISMVLSTGGR